jgi:hypothetical protein
MRTRSILRGKRKFLGKRRITNESIKTYIAKTKFARRLGVGDNLSESPEVYKEADQGISGVSSKEASSEKVND